MQSQTKGIWEIEKEIKGLKIQHINMLNANEGFNNCPKRAICLLLAYTDTQTYISQYSGF